MPIIKTHNLVDHHSDNHHSKRKDREESNAEPQLPVLKKQATTSPMEETVTGSSLPIATGIEGNTASNISPKLPPTNPSTPLQQPRRAPVNSFFFNPIFQLNVIISDSGTYDNMKLVGTENSEHVVTDPNLFTRESEEITEIRKKIQAYETDALYIKLLCKALNELAFHTQDPQDLKNAYDAYVISGCEQQAGDLVLSVKEDYDLTAVSSDNSFLNKIRRLTMHLNIFDAYQAPWKIAQFSGPQTGCTNPTPTSVNITIRKS